MKAIGGYPELELRKGEHYHKDAIKLNTARNCLEYILLTREYRKVYLPYYTCEAIFEPFRKQQNNPQIEFYHINKNLEPFSLPRLNEGEAFLYTNYFGLKQDTVEMLAERYNEKLIVDNSQAFYALPIPGIDTFYSPRKFVGVPDGAYLYTDRSISDYFGGNIEMDESSDRLAALVKRIEHGAEAGYEDFVNIEKSLEFQPIKKMSKLTEALLCSIDYEVIKTKRRDNYLRLYWDFHKQLDFGFKLRMDAVPLCYPYLATSPGLRDILIRNKIFVPTYWPNVITECDKETIEYKYTNELIPLPIGQNYNDTDMDRIIRIINLQK